MCRAEAKSFLDALEAEPQVRWAAEAAVAAVSDVTIRNAVVKAGLPVVLATYQTFAGPTKVTAQWSLKRRR